MSAKDMLRTQRIGFIGCGNLGQAILRAFLDSEIVTKENILVSTRTERKMQKIAEEFGVKTASTNEHLVDESNIIIIAVKPQDVYMTIEPIASSFHADHIVISLAAGISIEALQKLLPETNRIIRLMPNTAAKIKESVIAYSATPAVQPQLRWLEELFATMGLVVPVEDGEMMEALLVAASAGIGFVYELMIYWQEWLEERGISPEIAKKITVQTFKGASLLGQDAVNTSIVELQRKVTSTKGVTSAGLDSMRELEIERALRISFEKAALRDKELGDTWRSQKV